MTNRKVHATRLEVTAEPWSGIDAGRREQVSVAFTSLRHFRRSRRSVKPASAGRPETRPGELGATPNPHLSGPWPGRIELRGSQTYLRELRRLEMEAWQRTGGDVYRPSTDGPTPSSSRPAPRALADQVPFSSPHQ